MRIVLTILLAALAEAGCSGAADSERSTAESGEATAAAEAATPPPGLDTTRGSLLEADRAFARATAESRIEGWVSAFAPGGVMVSGTRTIGGLPAIRELMAPAFRDSTFSLSWDPTFAAASAAGDLGYTIGRYETRRRAADGSERIATGSYLTVWRRQADGTWKVEADIGSPADD